MSEKARKTVTVVFCDLADSTPLGEDLDPEALRAVYERYYAAVREIASAHGGLVEKYVGDGVLAVFGIPVAHEDDALRAARAAAQIRDAVAALGLTPRIGVETGEVIAGDPAPGHGFATGEAIVVASRLEKEAGANGILLGESTYRLVAHAVDATSLPPVALKGKREPVAVWRLESVADDAPALARRLDSRLVGRAAELSVLHAELEQAVAETRCRLVPVLGPAGVGKTRLLLEFVSGISNDCRVVTGRCPTYGEGATYAPVVEIVRELAGFVDGEAPETVRAKLSTALGAAGDDVAVETLRGLVASPPSPAPPEQTYWAVRRLLEAAARPQPLVVIFEDVERAEPTFLDLIDYLVGWSRERPILVCCLARTELLDERPQWATPRPDTNALLLSPLDDTHAFELLDALAGDAVVDTGLARRIVAAAAGNPLFAEELLRMLVDEGALRKEDGRWALEAGLDKIPVPGSIRAVLAARLDRLTPVERGVVQRAAVLGNEFWWSAVAELTDDDARGELAGALQTLVRKELVRPERSAIAGEDAFRFGHPLIRETAYDALPKRSRAVLHERAAAWLETRDAEDEIVGHHLEQAHRCAAELGEADAALAARAAERLTRAGRRAAERGDAPAAANLLQRAAALLPTRSSEQLTVLIGLAAALRAGGSLRRAREVAEGAVVDAAAAGDERLEMRARLENAAVQLRTHATAMEAEIDALATSALTLFEQLGDDEGLVATWRLIAHARWLRLRGGDMDEALEQVLEHERRTGSVRYDTSLLVELARAALIGRRTIEDAVDRCEELAEFARGTPAAEAGIAMVLGLLEACRGRGDVSRSLLGFAGRTFEELGLEAGIAAASMYEGMAALAAGDAPAAEATLRRTCELFDAIGDRAVYSTASALLARAFAEQGRFADATAAADDSEASASPGDVASQVWSRGARARALASAGDAEAARELATAALAVAETTDWDALQADALFDFAHATGDAQAARAAVALYERKGIVVAVDRARAWLDAQPVA